MPQIEKNIGICVVLGYRRSASSEVLFSNQAIEVVQLQVWNVHKMHPKFDVFWNSKYGKLGCISSKSRTSRCHTQTIRRRSDYIIGFVIPAINPNKSKKFTRLLALAHNIRSKFQIKTTYMASKTITCCLWSHVCCFSFEYWRVYCVRALKET